MGNLHQRLRREGWLVLQGSCGGLSDLDAVSGFLDLLGLLRLSESLCFNLFNRQLI